MISDIEKNYWIVCVDKVRKQIDLATLIWFWMRVENTDDWEKIVKTIEAICGDDIDSSFRYIPVGLDCYDDGISLQFGPNARFLWFKSYRSYIEQLNVFSDYAPSPEELEMLPVYCDEHTDNNDQLMNSPGWYENYEHPVLSNRSLTHRFISLDTLITRFESHGLTYPKEFSNRLADNTLDEGSTTEEVYSLVADDDPFRIYKLTAVVRKVLWSGDSKIAESLKRTFTNLDDKDYKQIVGAIFQVTPTEANYLRIYTQPHLERVSSGSSGADLSKMLKPIMKIMWLSGDVSVQFWLNQAKQEGWIKGALKIKDAEFGSLISIAKPREVIDEKAGSASFMNPGRISNEARAQAVLKRANLIIENYLPELHYPLRDPTELKLYNQLKEYIIQNK